MTALHKLPIIDFANFATNPKPIAQKVLDACKSIGFFYVVNHGVPQKDVDKAFTLAETYFDLPSEEKYKDSLQDSQGYLGLYRELLDGEHRTKGDHKEFYNFRNFVNGKPIRPLPDVFGKNTDFIANFSRSCHSAAMQILSAFAIALEIPEEHGGSRWFSDRHDYDRPSFEVLRFLKYPRGGEESYKDPVRSGAHSDYGTITLLFQNKVAGLEVQESRTEWILAPLVENAVLVNVADQLEIWTNGLFKSTRHRVVFLPEHAHLDRYSIPFFVQAENDVLLSPIPSKLIPRGNEQEHLTSIEQLQKRMEGIHVNPTLT